MKFEESYKGQSRAAAVMAESVKEALRTFADQNEEFREAVEQGGSFSECMEAVAKGAGQSLSDLEAYRRAAGFFFKGAKVTMQLRIELEGDATKAEEKKGIIINLEDFL